MLETLGADFGSVRGRALEAVEFPLPSQLLVATARCALKACPSEGGGSQPVRIAVVTEDSNTLRARLVERGFHYLVRRPVHPVALRLLLLRALYRGDEKRVCERIPIGAPVSCRVGLSRRRGLLADLSTRGGRLLMPRGAEPDTAVTLQLPKELVQGDALSLPGWVVRCGRDACGTPDLPFDTALAFELLAPETDQMLRVFLDRMSRGPERVSEEAAARARAATLTTGPARLVIQPRRAYFRRSPRRLFRSRVVAIQQRDRAMRVLVGRDLSPGGMRIDPHADLRLGDKISVALFVGPEERVPLRAEVARDDGEAGLTLRFLDPAPGVARQLETLISGLPQLERIDGPEPAVASVIGEIAEIGAYRHPRQGLR
jgi:hypothetical protein